jgi:uncharacterized protein (DUF433 family)
MASPAKKHLPTSVTITSIPEIMGGMACVAGTRVPAETILACINAGETVYDIFSGYPYLPFGSVEAVVEWAQANGRDVLFPIRRMPDAGFGRGRE